MTDLRTAAQQALEDLKDLHANHNITYAGTIAALEAALAQQQVNPPGCDHCNHPLYAATRCRVCGRVTEQAEPVQEPVAWLYEAGTDRTLHWYKPPLHGTPLYTSPPQRKPLTQEEIIDATEHIDTSRNGYFIDIARAIERAHGIGGQE